MWIIRTRELVYTFDNLISMVRIQTGFNWFNHPDAGLRFAPRLMQGWTACGLQSQGRPSPTLFLIPSFNPMIRRRSALLSKLSRLWSS